MEVGNVPLVTATTQCLVQMVCLPVGKGLIFLQRYWLALLDRAVCLLFWWFVKLFGNFGRRLLAGLLWVITGFFERQVLASQLRLLVQTSRALQIGTGTLGMSKASESPR